MSTNAGGWGSIAPQGGAVSGGGSGGAGWAGLTRTEDLNVAQTCSLVSPRQVKADIPMSAAANRTVVESRQAIQSILSGSDSRLLAVVGPCSIHDPAAALDYARRLHDIAREVRDRIYVVMRVYFEKPRTVVGWKGLINDPHLDGSFDIETGLRRGRELLLRITENGLPAGTEMLDPITPQYLADLISWASIGARTIESQTHRQMASGLSMPVGYKNATSGDLQIAINAFQAARQGHSFLGIDDQGRTAIVKTRGNKWGHVILRGGANGPNYDAHAVAAAQAALAKAGLPQAIMVDCSHANSGKQYQNQEAVWKNVIDQRKAGNAAIIGVLAESNLIEGKQPFPQPASKLRYGQSITDPCIGWECTAELLRWAHARLR